MVQVNNKHTIVNTPGSKPGLPFPPLLWYQLGSFAVFFPRNVDGTTKYIDEEEECTSVRLYDLKKKTRRQKIPTPLTKKNVSKETST